MHYDHALIGALTTAVLLTGLAHNTKSMDWQHFASFLVFFVSLVALIGLFV